MADVVVNKIQNNTRKGKVIPDYPKSRGKCCRSWLVLSGADIIRYFYGYTVYNVKGKMTKFHVILR